MHFGNASAFLLYWLVLPLFIYLAWRTWKITKNTIVFFDKKTGPKMLSAVSPIMVAIKYILLLLAFVFIITALARPWGKPIKSEINLSGIDIMVAVDVSSSMAAGDLKPSRMEVIKQGLKDFTASLAGDRIGMMTFAGTDFIQCPLTNDYDAYDLIIDSLYPGMLFKDGTALGDAIKASVERMVEKAAKSKILILITDGESNMGMAPIAAAKIAKEKDIRIYTIGVGTLEGGRIPEGKDMFGRVYFKTYEGAEVVTKLDDRELREISGLTGGKYYRVTDFNAFKAIKDDIRYMEENKTKKEEMKYEENYTLWLLWGIIFFVASQALSVRKIADFKLPFIFTKKNK
ncbi:MAG: VWA domain-containing protein [bacterium]